jgi:hypothetical protein
MTIALRYIENKPILIAEFAPPLDMYVDLHALKEAIYQLHTHHAQVVHLVIDYRRINILLQEAMMGIAQSQTAPKSLRNIPIYVYTIGDANNKVWQFIHETGQKGVYGSNYHFEMVTSEAAALERIDHITSSSPT